MEKKIISKGKFIFHIVLSFIVWFGITNLFLHSILGSLIYSVTKTNIYLYLISLNLVCIIESIIEIALTYFFNRKHRVSKYQLLSVKRFSLVLFYLLLVEIFLTSQFK